MYVDPSGHWNETIHYGTKKYEEWIDGTMKWAIEAGFSEKQANMIAKADNGVDKGFTNPMPWGDPSYHFNISQTPSGSDGDTRNIHAKEQMAQAIAYKVLAEQTLEKGDKELSAQLEEISLKYLGKGLHSLQDVGAHKNRYLDKNFNAIGIKSHWPNGMDADNPIKNKDGYIETRNATKDYFEKYKNTFRFHFNYKPAITAGTSIILE